MPRLNRTELRLHLLGALLSDRERWWTARELGDKLHDWVPNGPLLRMVGQNLIEIDYSDKMYRYQITELGAQAYKEWAQRSAVLGRGDGKRCSECRAGQGHKMDCSRARWVVPWPEVRPER